MKRAFLLAGSLGLVALAAQTASAEQVNSVNSLMSATKQDAVGQVTSVSQLSDVQPTDWAFQALQSLVERYGCIAGYPDGTFRGNRAATRYELAAALNACLDQISDRFATKEDLATVKALQEEFKTELATLKGRVDGLEARTKTLEAQQFSTTTKLQGEVVMAVQYGDTFGSTNPGTVNLSAPGAPLNDTRATALARVRLNFNTSFTGSDLLQTQLEVGNAGLDTFSNVSGAIGDSFTTGFAGSPPLYDYGQADYSGIGTNVTLRRLAYSFKPAKNMTVTIGPRLFPSDFVDFNSYANNSAQDFSSGVFINNPLIINNVVDTLGGAGAAVDFKFGTSGVTARAVYVAASPTNSTANVFGGGLFGDPYQATGELEFAKAFGTDKKNNFAIRAQYTNSSAFDVHQNVVGLNAEATFGRFGVFGRGGYSINPSFIVGPLGALLASNNNDGVVTWQAGVGVKDLFIPGSLLAAAVGMPYMVLGQAGPEQMNYEGFYRFPINDNITITPAVMVITDSGNVNTNTAIQGVLRATFSF
ncbi:iron uptake porin [Altericista sp. CCNU0014]|uniref:iron uptake porin n=1 Tax=Altericista sp. CCNU0014 TaxID=3082949 RepID=UPI003851433A